MRISNFTKSTLSVVAITSLLSACSSMVTTKESGAAQSQSTASAKKSGFKTEVSTAKAFAGKTDVVIGSFKVSFITREKSSSKPRGSILSGPSVARAAAETHLAGVPNEVMQAITDAAFADFKSQLTTQGYTVRPASLLTGNQSFNKAVTKPSPLQSDEPVPALKEVGS